MIRNSPLKFYLRSKLYESNPSRGQKTAYFILLAHFLTQKTELLVYFNNLLIFAN